MTSVNYDQNSSNNRPIGRGGSEAAVDSWNHTKPRSAEAEETLSVSKMVRGDAEEARQTIANEILEAAKAVCGELISDTERTLQKARYLESEADRKHLEAHTELERSEDIRRDAELYRDEIIEEAKRQVEEILDRGRATAEREASEMRQRASIEAEKMLASARVMREAASEELEAQKIYAEAARFKADSQGTLRQAQTRLVEGRTEAQIKSSARDIPAPPPPPASVVKTINSGISDAAVDHQAKVDQAAALANALAKSVEPPKGDMGRAKDGSPIQALEELRDMHKATSKAVNAAMAKNKKTTKAKSAPKGKKPAAKKTSK